MPVTFTDGVVDTYLKAHNLDQGGSTEDRRRRLANYIEPLDRVEAWEIRTGRPLEEMTSLEARDLIQRYPDLANNIGVVSRLLLT